MKLLSVYVGLVFARGILLAGFASEGYLYRKGTTKVRATLDADIAAEVLGDLACQREAQTRAIGAGRALSAVEAVEDMRYLGFGDTTAAVGNAYKGVTVFTMEFELHGLLPLKSARVLQGVVEKDGEHAVELDRVGLNRGDALF